MIGIFKYFSSLLGWVLLVMIIISLYFNITVEKGDNDCMQTYVAEIKENPTITGYYYKTPYDSYHIDTREYKEYKKIWIARGCLITPLDNRYVIENIFNSIYCYTTFIIN